MAAVGRTHRRITNIRRNYAHQLTRAIVNAADVICVEDLHVKGMMQGRVAHNSRTLALAKYLRQIQYKADWYDRRLIEVGRFYPSSKTSTYARNVQNIGWANLDLRWLRCSASPRPQCRREHQRRGLRHYRRECGKWPYGRKRAATGLPSCRSRWRKPLA